MTYTVSDCKTGEVLKFPVHVDNLRNYTPDLLHPDTTPTTTSSEPAKTTVAPPAIITTTSPTPDTNQSTTRSDIGSHPKSSTDDSGRQPRSKHPVEHQRSQDTPTSADRFRIQSPTIGNDTTLNDESSNSDDNKSENDSSSNSDAEDDTDQWHDAIRLLKSKQVKGKTQYLVKWADPTSAPSWEPEDHITDTMIQEFQTHFLPSGKRRKRAVRAHTR